MKAIWKDRVIAESDATVEVDGNHYFPRPSVKEEFLLDSDKHTTCGWKGVASYCHVVVDGERNDDAAWYYPDPREAAAQIAGHFAFWRGVQVVE